MGALSSRLPKQILHFVLFSYFYFTEYNFELNIFKWACCCPQVALPKCSSCHQPLQAGSVSVMGCSFHPQCFTCSVCGDPITGNYIPKEGGKFICEKDFQVIHWSIWPKLLCYLQKTEDACDVCGEAMVGRVLSAVNKQFHPACFRSGAPNYFMPPYHLQSLPWAGAAGATRGWRGWPSITWRGSRPVGTAISATAEQWHSILFITP